MTQPAATYEPDARDYAITPERNPSTGQIEFAVRVHGIHCGYAGSNLAGERLAQEILIARKAADTTTEWNPVFVCWLRALGKPDDCPADELKTYEYPIWLQEQWAIYAKQHSIRERWAGALYRDEFHTWLYAQFPVSTAAAPALSQGEAVAAGFTAMAEMARAGAKGPVSATPAPVQPVKPRRKVRSAPAEKAPATHITPLQNSARNDLGIKAWIASSEGQYTGWTQCGAALPQALGPFANMLDARSAVNQRCTELVEAEGARREGFLALPSDVDAEQADDLAAAARLAA